MFAKVSNTGRVLAIWASHLSIFKTVAKEIVNYFPEIAANPCSTEKIHQFYYQGGQTKKWTKDR